MSTRIARLLSRARAADTAVRFELMGQLGRIRRRTVRGGGQAFFLDFRPYGRVWSHCGVRITDPASADRLLEQIRAEVAKGQPLEGVLARYKPAAAKASLMPTWLDRWIAGRRREMEAGGLSPNFVRELERLCAPAGHFSFFDPTSIHDVTLGLLEDWSLWLADRRQSPKSRRNYLGYIRSFLRWLELRGEITKAPRFPSVRVDEHAPRVLAISDQDAVLACISEEERGIFLALAHLGLRPGEARALVVSDYQGGWLQVSRACKGKSVSAPIRGTKTGKTKRLPVSDGLRAWIEAHVDAADRLQRRPLFPNPRTGRPWPHKALQRVWSRALAEAELPSVSLYEGTKHTMATDAIRRGVPERLLQQFLGHASVESTRRYARLGDNALLEVLRQPPEPRGDK
jgi:integrase